MLLGIDHFVLTVKDMATTCSFYEKLGMTVREFGSGRIAMHFGSVKINLHQIDKPVDPFVKHASCGGADFCLLTSTPVDQLKVELQRRDIEVVLGPIERTGAQGLIQSIYVYDPDENLIELANKQS